MPKIIIIGIDHHNTLSMVRCFGEMDYKSVLIIYGTDKSYVASSIYLERAYVVPKAADAINTLKNIVENESEKPVVITCPDEISSLMDLEYDFFKDKCYFFNAGVAGRITYYMDKQRQVTLAAESGFDVPWSFELFPSYDLPNGICYPCFVKPKESIHGGKHISICRNQKELNTALSEFDANHSILVQKYIQKDYEIVILGMTTNGKTYIPGYVRKEREFRGGTTYCHTLPIEKLGMNISKNAEKLVSAICYEGLWGLECIIRGDKCYFIELNMRNDATTYAMKVAGVNMPVAYYISKTGQNYYDLLSTKPSEISSIVEFQDFNFVLKFKICLFSWLRQLRNAKCHYMYSKEDIDPYKLSKKEYIRFLKKRILHI